jgi:hypothetical protein
MGSKSPGFLETSELELLHQIADRRQDLYSRLSSMFNHYDRFFARISSFCSDVDCRYEKSELPLFNTQGEELCKRSADPFRHEA